MTKKVYPGPGIWYSSALEKPEPQGDSSAREVMIYECKDTERRISRKS